jgi:hypothetical protein
MESCARTCRFCDIKMVHEADLRADDRAEDEVPHPKEEGRAPREVSHARNQVKKMGVRKSTHLVSIHSHRRPSNLNDTMRSSYVEGFWKR